MVALVDSVCAAYPMDSHVERDALLTPTGAWMFEDPMTVFMLSYVTETDPTDGVEFAMFFLWICPHPGWTGPPVSFLTWPLTKLTVAEMYAEAPRTQVPWDWLRFIGAGSALLRQRLLVAESAEAQPRAERRRLARAGADLSGSTSSGSGRPRPRRAPRQTRRTPSSGRIGGSFAGTGRSNPTAPSTACGAPSGSRPTVEGAPRRTAQG